MLDRARPIVFKLARNPEYGTPKSVPRQRSRHSRIKSEQYLKLNKALVDQSTASETGPSRLAATAGPAYLGQPRRGPGRWIWILAGLGWQDRSRRSEDERSRRYRSASRIPELGAIS